MVPKSKTRSSDGRPLRAVVKALRLEHSHSARPSFSPFLSDQQKAPMLSLLRRSHCSVTRVWLKMHLQFPRRRKRRSAFRAMRFSFRHRTEKESPWKNMRFHGMARFPKSGLNISVDCSTILFWKEQKVVGFCFRTPIFRISHSTQRRLISTFVLTTKPVQLKMAASLTKKLFLRKHSFSVRLPICHTNAIGSQ